MASKIFTTQDWRLICDTEEDQSTATDLKIFAKDSDGKTTEFSPAILDSNTNRIYYDIGTTEMAVAGTYKVWPKTTISGNVAPGDPAVIIIFVEGD